MKFVRRLLPSADIDALLGDISEEACRRSRVWYWAQLAAVLAVGSARDMKRHPFVALRTVGLGIGTLIVLLAPASVLVRVVRVLSEGGYYIGPYWLTLPSNTIRWLPVLINALGFATSGWTIARFHRSHGIAMLMPFVLLWSVIAAIVLLNVVRHLGPWFVPTLPVLSLLSLPACVLIGGVLGLAPTRREHRNRP